MKKPQPVAKPNPGTPVLWVALTVDQQETCNGGGPVLPPPPPPKSEFWSSEP